MELPNRFGVPQYREVVIRSKTQTYDQQSGLYVDTVTDNLVTPNPKISTIRPSLVGMEVNETVTLSQNDWELKIVRNMDILGMNAIDYIIIDPVLNSANQVVGGQKVEILYINQNKITDWLLVVRKSKDSYNIAPANAVK
jgi:hypothetical protein